MIRSTTSLRLTLMSAAAAAALVAGGASATVTAAPASKSSPAAAECQPAAADVARVRDGSAAEEPKLFSDQEAKAYGTLPDKPTLPAGSVKVRTVFHSISDHPLTPTEKARFQTMIEDQMTVLNDSYSGKTATNAADTPFRFTLDVENDINWIVDGAWYTVTPGKTERDMKKQLHEGDSTTLNVYSANIGGGLLGWAYFPKDYNSGRDYIDGVVMLDESMPGGLWKGKPWKYGEGDTLTHEVGHWLMLHHTFNSGCSASGDFVADTPKEAFPQFNCPVGADSCAAPGLDPIHNFMDYSQDSCMDMFTQGQADRMSDGWLAFRAGGNG